MANHEVLRQYTDAWSPLIRKPGEHPGTLRFRHLYRGGWHEPAATMFLFPAGGATAAGGAWYDLTTGSYHAADPAGIARINLAAIDRERQHWADRAAALDPMTAVHTVLDVIGLFDPTPVSDGLNAALYAVEGDMKNAAISLAGALLPYAGDLVKGTKYVKALTNGVSTLAGSAGCRLLSAGIQGVAGAVGGAAMGAAYGFTSGLIESGELSGALAGAWSGAKFGAIQGGLGSAVRGAIKPFVCFAAGTHVITGINADGTFLLKKIEDIEEGDEVLARDQYDEGDGVQLRKVTKLFRNASDHLRVVTIRDRDGNVETIRTTDEHPFWVESINGGEGGWIAAKDLKGGDRLNEGDGSNDAIVLSSTRQEIPQGVEVYNFEVEGDHTYFVEDGVGRVTAVWVHNVCNIAESVAKGKAGEKAGGITQAKKGIIGPESGRMRFPDEVTKTLIKEVKNVKYQGLTSQIRDYIAIAKKEKLPFELWVRSGTGTKISAPLQAAENAGLLKIVRAL